MSNPSKPTPPKPIPLEEAWDQLLDGVLSAFEVRLAVALVELRSDEENAELELIKGHAARWRRRGVASGCRRIWCRRGRVVPSVAAGRCDQCKRKQNRQ